MPSRSKKHKSTMITVEHMVDIALGTPEVGAVNFNVLHALLHVIVQQLNIQKCLVEFKGHDSERMEGIIMTAKPGPILKISEYLLDLKHGKPCPEKYPWTAQPVQPERPDKKSKLAHLNESKICPPKDNILEENIETDGRCVCGPEKRMGEAEKTPKEEKVKKSASKDETEKAATIQEKKNKDLEDEGPDSTTKEDLSKKKPDKKEYKTDKESEDWKKLSKKERCREKKLMKRKMLEEEQILLEGEAQEKSEAEKSENERTKKMDEVTVDERNDSKQPCDEKTKPCPCKADGTADTTTESHKQEDILPEQKLKETSSTYYGSDDEGGCQTIVRVETIGERCDSWRSRPALAHDSLVKLEERVTLLQDAFEALEKMPTNKELMQRTSGSGFLPTPVKDMWQMYNLNKRVESCEGAIEKLASMIEDLVKETCNFREALMVIADAVDMMECHEDTCANRLNPCCGGDQAQPSKVQPQETVTNGTEIMAYPLVLPKPCGAFAAKTSVAEQRTAQDHIQTPQETVEDESMAITPRASLLPPTQPTIGIGPDFFKLSNGEKFCALKEEIDCLTCQMKKFTDMIPLDQLASKLCAIVTMQKKLDNLQTEWEQFLQSFGNNGVAGAVDYIKALRAEIRSTNDRVSKILEDRRQLELIIQGLQQEINMLKAMKADKETMEDLLAEKADASIVNRKVSHDQFDAACDDLTKGLDDALERLIAQESLWNDAMEDLQKDMENKLDKLEIMPLKEFINKKLKGLQEKLKQLAQLRKDAEAAGAKSRILRNLNCIACDNDVIMRMDNKSASQHPSLPPSRSMRPYIAYDLDQVRKALKKSPCPRSASQSEEQGPEVQKKTIGLAISREGGERRINKLEHYCNRYCGGSHTITTPQQRVTRIGHFLTEFGPQALATLNQECKRLDKDLRT